MYISITCSVKAIRENIVALRPLLPRIVELLRTGQCLPSDSTSSSGGSGNDSSDGHTRSKAKK